MSAFPPFNHKLKEAEEPGLPQKGSSWYGFGMGLAMVASVATFVQRQRTQRLQEVQTHQLQLQTYQAEIERLKNEQVAAQLAFQHEISQLETERASSEIEMEVAHEIQSSLMAPSEIETANWHMAACSIPTKGVGGDFYDYITYFDDESGGIAIGDVAGKGIPAALQMAVVRTLFRVEARRRIFPGHTINSVNIALSAERSFGMVTMLYAFVDPSTSLLHLANAGHNYPILLSGGLNGTLEELELPGLPLGIDDSAEYEELVVKLEPGTSVVLYTDGVVEAFNGQGELYGFDRFKQVLRENQTLTPRALVNLIMADLAIFTEDAPQSDDITVVVLQYDPKHSLAGAGKPELVRATSLN